MPPVSPRVLLALPVLLSACADSERSAFDPADDSAAPVLRSVEVVTNEAGTAAYVEWTADEPVRAVVEYGENGELLHHSYSGALGFSSTGRARLLAAEPNHAYDYAIRMWDRAGNETSATDPELETLDTPALADEPLLLIAMIDVGWGDAIYLEVPDASLGEQVNVLIDAGHPLDGMVVRRFLQRHGVTGLDYASLSHIHEDHIGGFYGDGFVDADGILLSQGGGNSPFPVGTFIDAANKTVDNSGPYGRLLEALSSLRTSGRLASLDTLSWNESSRSNDALKWGDAQVDVLAAGRKPYLRPEYAVATNDGSVINNDSIVYRLQYGEFVALLTGDAEFATEQFIQDHWSANFIRAHLLKLGHHGSNDASSERWVDLVKPYVGFIPNAVSENPGVEHPFVLNRLRNRSIDYYASDRVIPNRDRALPGVRGDLLLYTDGVDFTIVVENVRYE